jgi:dihydrofolate reductase
MEKLRESPFFVIGGASLFEKALPLAETLYLTEIHQQIEGDTFFPPINWNLFLQKEREEHKAPPFNYSFSTWSRR